MTSTERKMAPSSVEMADSMDTGQARDARVAGDRCCDDGSVSRRRFARAGLTGSVLLGSLASKPVLGASIGCTVSGQMSGNLSREALDFICDVGMDPGEWLAAATWPAPFQMGTLPLSTDCTFSAPAVQGTPFNGWTPGAPVPVLGPAFFFETTAPCTVVTTNTGSPATMLQVLNTTSADPQFQLGRAVVASLLNIAAFPDYAVTYHTAISMFNATFGGGNYVVGTVTWSRARVIAYLESLYQPAV